MKSNCCHIVECNNCCENINCNDCPKVCCGSIDICAQNGGTKEMCVVKINECEFNNLLKEIKCEVGDQTYKIINSILIGLYLYIFIGAKRKTKNNILCAIQAKVDLNTKKANDGSLKIQMCYNIYSVAKNNSVCKEDALNLRIVQVTYNPYDDLFIVLFSNHHQTLFGKIEHLESIHSIGTSLQLINCKETCSLLILDYKPVSICPICKDKYRLVVVDCHTKCSKSFNVCF